MIMPRGMIVTVVRMVIDHADERLAPDGDVQSGFGVLLAAKYVAGRIVPEFKLRRLSAGFCDGNQLVLGRLAANQQVQGNRAFLSRNRDAIFRTSIEQIDRHSVAGVIMDQFSVVFFLSQFDEVSVVRSHLGMVMVSVIVVSVIVVMTGMLSCVGVLVGLATASRESG
jgi:hypothetical protein